MEPTDDQPSTIPSPLYLGLGLGFSLFLLSRSPPLRPLSAAVKLADGAIKGTKAIRNPSPSALISASKALFKGYKATAKLINPAVESALSFPPLSSKKVKAIFGAASLVRYAISPISSDGFLLLSLLKCGYKISKSSAKVLEGFIGLQIDKTVRTGVDALGFALKTTWVVKELTCWLAIGWWGSSAWNSCKPESDFRFIEPLIIPRCTVHLHCEYSRFHSDRVYLYEREFYNNKMYNLYDGDLDGDAKARVGLCETELLCLSIPLHETIPINFQFA